MIRPGRNLEGRPIETPHPLTLLQSPQKEWLSRQPCGRPDRHYLLLLLLFLHRHFQKDARSVLTARPDSVPGQPLFPYSHVP